jgi:hypothetical protein
MQQITLGTNLYQVFDTISVQIFLLLVKYSEWNVDCQAIEFRKRHKQIYCRRDTFYMIWINFKYKILIHFVLQLWQFFAKLDYKLI